MILVKNEGYKCNKPPCIHVVIDDRRKLFKIFVEDYDYIIPIERDKLMNTCKVLFEDPRMKRYKEAVDDEIDYLARKYLKAEPLSEED